MSNATTFNPVLVAGGGGGATNEPPAASFTYLCNDFACTFTDTSTDSDGSIVSWSWTFGEESAVSTDQSPSHTYAADGTYTVTLAVTDDDGATSTTSQAVSVPAAPAPEIRLSAAARQVKTNKYADLTWSGASSSNVDVYRSAAFVITTPNDGAYTDKPPKTITSASYRVCEAGTSSCSNDVTVTW